MKIKTEDLRAALKTTAPAVMVNPTNPSLAAAHLAAAEGVLTVRTTNYDTWIETRIAPVQADVADWSAAVSHALLNKIAGLARAKEAEIVPGERMVAIAAGKASWELPLIVGEFPSWPAATDPITALDGEAFVALVSRVASAAADKEGFSPPLNVVEVAVRDGRLELAASDRYRLNIGTADLPADAAPCAVYPIAAQLLATADGLTGTVTLGARPGGEMFSLADERTTIQGRAVAVEKWLKVSDTITNLRAKIGGTTLVPADDLANAIKAAQVTLPDGEGVRVMVTPDEFVIGSTDEESGARSTIPLEDFEHTGRGIITCLNPRIALPTLALFGADAVEIGWTGPQAPAVATLPGDTGGAYVLTPMRRADAAWIDAEDGAA